MMDINRLLDETILVPLIILFLFMRPKLERVDVIAAFGFAVLWLVMRLFMGSGVEPALSALVLGGLIYLFRVRGQGRPPNKGGGPAAREEG